MWYKHHPFITAIVILTFLSSTSPPLIHFRRYRFTGGDDVAAAAADALKPPKRTTSDSHVDAREVEVVGDASKRRKERKTPPPARVWTRGRRWWWVTCRKYKKNHLRLAFGREGGGSGRSLGLTGVSSGRRKNEWEKTGNDICHCPFLRCTVWAHFLGPPSHSSTPNSLAG